MAQFLRGKKFQSVEDVEVAVEEFFASKYKEWFYQTFKELAEKWVKIIEHEGFYFEYRISFIFYVFVKKISFRIRQYLWDILSNSYTWPIIIRVIKLRKMRWAGNVVSMREKRNAYRILVGKSEGKRPL
jgi:hypothetical protein